MESISSLTHTTLIVTWVELKWRAYYSMHLELTVDTIKLQQFNQHSLTVWVSRLYLPPESTWFVWIEMHWCKVTATITTAESMNNLSVQKWHFLHSFRFSFHFDGKKIYIPLIQSTFNWLFNCNCALTCTSIFFSHLSLSLSFNCLNEFFPPHQMKILFSISIVFSNSLRSTEKKPKQK